MDVRSHADELCGITSPVDEILNVRLIRRFSIVVTGERPPVLGQYADVEVLYAPTPRLITQENGQGGWSRLPFLLPKYVLGRRRQDKSWTGTPDESIVAIGRGE